MKMASLIDFTRRVARPSLHLHYWGLSRGLESAPEDGRSHKRLAPWNGLASPRGFENAPENGRCTKR